MNQLKEGVVLEREQPRVAEDPANAPLAHVQPGGAVAEHQQAQATSLLAALTQAAMNPQVDMEKMKQLFAMHKEMVVIEAEAAFNAAMARAQQKMLPAIANQTNTHTSSTYADLAAIAKAITPYYTAEGLSVSYDADRPVPGHDGKPLPPPADGWFRTIALVSHSAGHTRLHHVDLPSDDVGVKGNTNKTPIQGVVSMRTYARRVLKCMVFDVSVKDDDGNAPPKKDNADKIREHRQQQEGQQQQPPTEKPAYGNDALTANLPEWKDLVAKGKKTSERIVSQLKARYTVTPEQEKRITDALAKVEVKK